MQREKGKKKPKQKISISAFSTKGRDRTDTPEGTRF